MLKYKSLQNLVKDFGISLFDFKITEKRFGWSITFHNTDAYRSFYLIASENHAERFDGCEDCQRPNLNQWLFDEYDLYDFNMEEF